MIYIDQPDENKSHFTYEVVAVVSRRGREGEEEERKDLV